MKKMMMIMAALMLTITMTAQPRPGKPGKQLTAAERVEKKTAQMVKRYELTDKQAKKVKKLNEKYQDKLEAPRMKPAGEQAGQQKPDAAKMEQLKKDHEAYNAELKKILTDSQYEKYQADAKKRFAHGKMAKGGPKPHGHMKPSEMKGAHPHGAPACCKADSAAAQKAPCCKKEGEAKAPCCKEGEAKAPCCKKEGEAKAPCCKKEGEAKAE